MKKIVEKILRRLARAYLRKYRPKIVAITGSVGKTSTKEAVFTVLRTKFSVWRNRKNYNSEIGLPLAILDAAAPKSPTNIPAWLIIFTRAIARYLFQSQYPEILVLEMGADKPGDLTYLTRLAPPDVAILTRIAESHMEFFKTPDALTEEKRTIIRALKPEGVAILNFDDETVRATADMTEAGAVITYGLEPGASVRAENPRVSIDKVGIQTFALTFNDKQYPVTLHGSIGRHQIYAALSAFAAGIAFKLAPVEIIPTLSEIKSPPSRMTLIEGIKNTLIIDDTYNSAPASAESALDTLAEIGTERRKIAVLGDMMELGPEAEPGHREIGRKAAFTADILITIGPRSAFTARAAKTAGLADTNIHHFEPLEAESDQIDQAQKLLEDIIRPGDLILIKASQALYLERLVKAIMRYPIRDKKLIIDRPVKSPSLAIQ